MDAPVRAMSGHFAPLIDRDFPRSPRGVRLRRMDRGECGMACPSADRGLRLGRASTLLDPRPRRRVWRCLHSAHPGHGHSRPTGLGAVALAERICGEADRLDPTGGDMDQRSHGATADRGG